ncbi:uncharacterized protein LOC134685558 [Mytilus trossulus]|uniref:uncharacterized protein LOC134685558 n=1 Tax=Mytilus trossulus TaxID=6551 RepID=UPI00300456AF
MNSRSLCCLCAMLFVVKHAVQCIPLALDNGLRRNRESVLIVKSVNVDLENGLGPQNEVAQSTSAVPVVKSVNIDLENGLRPQNEVAQSTSAVPVVINLSTSI